MAKAGGGGGAGAGGNGALTWVVSGGRPGVGVRAARGIVPGPRRGRNSAGGRGGGVGGWEGGERGKAGARSARGVGASPTETLRPPPLFFLLFTSRKAPAAGAQRALETLGDKP